MPLTLSRRALLSNASMWALAGAGHGSVARPRALVIGNSFYLNGTSLPNAVHDAHAVAAELRHMGYSVFEAHNVDRAQFLSRLVDLQTVVAPSEQVVIYFAGHGVQVGDETLLLMAGTTLEDPQWHAGAVPLRLVLTALAAQTWQKILLLDACRENPVSGVARMRPAPASFSAPAGTYIAYAAQPGASAYEGGGLHSPFTAALLAQMARPPQSIEETFRKVRIDVIRETNGLQVPWTRSSLVRRASLTPGFMRWTG